MKNIHLIPTAPPSNITVQKRTGKLLYDAEPFTHDEYDVISNQHIYIISNEEIKDIRPHKGKWQLEQGLMLNKFPTYLTDLSECKLVIMTTDQELIKDGVQAIDDEFLEWFVKNPNCDEVEIEVEFIQTFDNLKDGFYYKIIIPKEKPKQETTLKELLLQLRNTPMTFVPKEEYIKCGDCNKYYLCTTCGAQCGSEGHFIEITKQETTLEEAADKYAESKSRNFKTTHIRDFTAGAKWQKERMYSDEEVFNLCRAFATFVSHKDPSYKKQQEWFEQFKKK